MVLRRPFLSALSALTIVLVAPRVGGAAGSPSWATLEHRPLHLPRLHPGASCPVSKAQDLFFEGGDAWVLGPGPVYAKTPGDTAIMTFLSPSPHWSGFHGSPWSGQKVPWLMAPTVPLLSPVLIRGRELDGPHEVRFSANNQNDMHPLKELRVVAKPFVPSTFTRVRAPGCYGYQVDGVHFSEIIVFQAVNCLTLDPQRRKELVGC